MAPVQYPLSKKCFEHIISWVNLSSLIFLLWRKIYFEDCKTWLAVPGNATPCLAMPGLAVTGLAVPGLAVPGLAVPGLAVLGLTGPGLAVLGLTGPGLAVYPFDSALQNFTTANMIIKS